MYLVSVVISAIKDLLSLSTVIIITLALCIYYECGVETLCGSFNIGTKT